MGGTYDQRKLRYTQDWEGDMSPGNEEGIRPVSTITLIYYAIMKQDVVDPIRPRAYQIYLHATTQDLVC